MFAYNLNDNNKSMRIDINRFRDEYSFELFKYKLYLEKEVGDRVTLLAVPANKSDNDLPKLIGHFSDIYKRIQYDRVLVVKTVHPINIECPKNADLSTVQGIVERYNEIR